jgi:hypothetical protein
MVRDKEFPVYGINGFRATLLSPARFLDNSPEKKLRLEDGREVLVSASDLESKPDGSFYLKNPVTAAPEAEANPQVVPGPSYTGEPLFRENCDIKRVPMKRLLDKPAEPRQEGDTLIVPLMEEVLVLEKRLLLREELHITRRREPNPHVSPVRREEFEEPQPPPEPPPNV